MMIAISRAALIATMVWSVWLQAVTMAVTPDVREALYRRTGEVTGILVSYSYNHEPTTTMTSCARMCLSEGCGGFSLMSTQEGWRCVLSTDNTNLPLGVWNLYKNNLGEGGWNINANYNAYY